MQQILPEHPEGIRASELKRKINEIFPDALSHSIGSIMSIITDEYPSKFYKQRIKGEGTFYFPAQNDVTDEEYDENVLTDQPKESDDIASTDQSKESDDIASTDQSKESDDIASTDQSKESDDIASTDQSKESDDIALTDQSKESDNIATQADQPKEGDDVIQENKYKEKDFYKSFAEYLQYGDSDDEDEYHHLDECTKAISVGGNTRDKWGTPDVIGVLRYDYNDYVKFPDEIVSAEIKIDNASDVILTGFGQACAYRLFSHKTYLVIPELNDIRLTNRIEKLCQIFGIGLVYFDPKQEPNVSIYKLKLPAQKHSPDLFYMNETVRNSYIADKLYGIKPRKSK